MSHPCGCVSSSTIVDQARHDAWHALVIEQGGPAGLVNAETLQAARGFTFAAIGDTVFDVKARKSGRRASGEQRRRAR